MQSLPHSAHLRYELCSPGCSKTAGCHVNSSLRLVVVTTMTTLVAPSLSIRSLQRPGRKTSSARTPSEFPVTTPSPAQATKRDDDAGKLKEANHDWVDCGCGADPL